MAKRRRLHMLGPHLRMIVEYDPALESVSFGIAAKDNFSLAPTALTEATVNHSLPIAQQTFHSES
ncbi:hypothetical protein [Mesorhizobium salmacidum]|uniref:Uncharacterized protein n=1 Tax=Mesorhizobium salmacidum TaxID=3015171 RepID=A0ABU8KSL8_9HYPH